MHVLEEKIGRRKALTDRWMEIYRAGESKGFSPEELDQLQQLQVELEDLGREIETLQQMQQKAQQFEGIARQDASPQRQPLWGGDASRDEPEGRTLGEMFISSPEYKRLRGQPGLPVDGVSVTGLLRSEYIAEEAYQAHLQAKGWGRDRLLASKAVVLSGLSLPRPDRQRFVQQQSYQKPVVQDLIPEVITDQMAISFLAEGTNTNAAAPTDEGQLAPESALGNWTEVVEPVRWIPTILPVTEQLLRSEPQVQQFINDRLLLFVRMTEEAQILSGNGTAPNLKGIFATGRNFQTRAVGTDESNFDAIYAAFTLVRTSNLSMGYEPDGIIMNPSDVEKLRLAKDNNGNYIYGSPADADAGVNVIWGVRVIPSTVVPAGTAYVGAFGSAAQIFRFWEYGVTVFSEHADYPARRMLLMRADTALALAVYQEQAFVKVTGIA